MEADNRLSDRGQIVVKIGPIEIESQDLNESNAFPIQNIIEFKYR